MRELRAIIKFVLFLLWSALLVPPQIIVLAVHRGPHAYTLPYIWERGVCRIFGLKVSVKGTPNTEKQTIFMANHLSYLDIPVIASILKASFVAKADVAGWPVFGFLSRMQQTAFIERSRQHISAQRYTLQNMLKDGKSLIIFPEGTSTDGRDVMPFKTSLFSIAQVGGKDNIPLEVQPITLRLLAADGQKADTDVVRDLYAWHGDMTMAPHLWAFAKSSGAKIELVFHAPYSAATINDRKILAKKCHEDVLDGLQSMAMAA